MAHSFKILVYTKSAKITSHETILPNKSYDHCSFQRNLHIVNLIHASIFYNSGNIKITFEKKEKLNFPTI